MWQAPVAQWIERQFPELKVVGSNPIRRTIYTVLIKKQLFSNILSHNILVGISKTGAI
jgi:hypothetical protein